MQFPPSRAAQAQEQAWVRGFDRCLCDLGLAAARPVHPEGLAVALERATAAAVAIGVAAARPRIKGNQAQVQQALQPLLLLVMQFPTHQAAACAAEALAVIVKSKQALVAFERLGATAALLSVLRNLLLDERVDWRKGGVRRDTIFQCTLCLRELALMTRWDIVSNGGIALLVMILREGDDALKGAAAGCVAMIAADPSLAELIYTSGVGKFLLATVKSSFAPCALAVLGALAILCQSGCLAKRLVDDGMVEELFKCLRRSSHTAAASGVKTKALAALLVIVENNVSAGRIATCCLPQRDEDGQDDDGEDEGGLEVDENILQYLEVAFDSESAEHVTIALKLLLHVHPHCSVVQLHTVRGTVQRQLESRHWIHRTFAATCLTEIYQSMDDKWAAAEAGAIPQLMHMLQSKHA